MYLHSPWGQTATLATLLARLSDRMQSDEKQRRELDSLTKIVES
jgi:hypothetical protein